MSKKLYYHTYFEQNANNLKNTWKGINILLINRNKKNIKQITALRKPNNVGISYNASEIPDIMNNHFATIGNNLIIRNHQLPLQVIYHVSPTQVLLFSSQFYQPKLN